MNCPNCGRPLEDGEVCTCQQEPTVPPIPEQEQVQPEPEQTPIIEQEQTQPAQQIPEQEQIPPVYQDEYYNQGSYTAPNQGYYVPPEYQQPNMYQQPVYMPARTDYPQGYKIKKKYVAVLLAFFLGGLGIHNFYLGNKGKGVAQVLLTTVGSLFLGIGPIVTAVWVIVETVQLLTETIDADANGFKIQTLEEAIVAKMAEKE